MNTPASVARHPIHPMLVVLPIGLWIFSLACDLIYRLGWGGDTWDVIALYTIGGGIVGALLAAVPGFIDLFSIPPGKTKKIAITHMALNLAAVVVYAVNFGVRLNSLPGATLPLVLSLAGVAVIGVSGWLGGEMVYVQGVGVDREAARPPVE